MAADWSRDDLITRVQYGALWPAEAEREAERLGFGPLACTPDPAAFDPTREAYWTLPMTVAWIAWRSVDHVRNWWNAYREECRDWRFREWRNGPDGSVHAGHFLEARSKPTLAALRLAEQFDISGGAATAVMSVTATIDSLWGALQRGSVQATGVERRSHMRAAIRAEQWQDLKVVEQDGRDIVVAESRLAGGRNWFEEVTLASAVVQALWPPAAPAMARLPDLVSPHGGGYMALYCAAQWIATQGGAIDLPAADGEIWHRAYGDLLRRIAAGAVEVTGMRHGERERIEGFRFADCPVAYPHAGIPHGLLFGNETYLSSYPYIDDEHWRGGQHDSLESRQGVRWARLLVNKDDIAKLWPFGHEAPPRTGAPGRPSSMHLVKAELQRRGAEGSLLDTLRATSRQLEDWIKLAHPAMPPPTAKAIENAMRGDYRRLCPPKS